MVYYPAENKKVFGKKMNFFGRQLGIFSEESRKYNLFERIIISDLRADFPFKKDIFWETLLISYLDISLFLIQGKKQNNNFLIQ